MKLQKPLIPLSLSEPEDIAELFESEDSISGFLIENVVLTTQELNKRSLSECVINKSDFSQVSVPRFDVQDCEFKACNFIASQFPDSSWLRTSIGGARCSGLQIANSKLRSVEFKNSKLDIVNFRFSQLDTIVFEDCVLNDVDFYEARLKNVEFIHCTINKITFDNAKMVNVDISASTVEEINGINSLKGVTMSYDQLLQLAPSFAAEAGIKIK